MQVIDLNGEKIGVTDLGLAIMQADDYRHYELSGSANADFNRKKQAYWQDIYIKLILLEKAQQDASAKTENHDNL